MPVHTNLTIPHRRATHAAPRRSGSTTMSASSGTEAARALAADLVQGTQGAAPLDVKPLFDALTAPGSVFAREYWQRRPVAVHEPLDCLVNAWTMGDMERAVADEFLCEWTRVSMCVCVCLYVCVCVCMCACSCVSRSRRRAR
jgi:hypothetical protein